jgi:hypothetical protein
MEMANTVKQSRPPIVKSPGAILLTKQAALETVHSITATQEQHDDALRILTEIARSELLPPAAR